MKSRRCALFILVTAAFSNVSARDCGLVFNVLDPWTGQPRPYKVTAFDSQAMTIGAAKYASRFRGLRADKVPCGDYRYQLAAESPVDTKYGQITGHLTLYDPHQKLTLETDGTVVDPKTGMAYAVEGGAPRDHPIKGSASGLTPGVAPAVVRLVDLAHNHPAREVEVDAQGHFEFQTPWSGSYVLLLILDERFLGAQPLSVEWEKDPPPVEFRVPVH